MEKFNNKYRIPSARLQTWDYASNGLYFITICTKNREHYFGEIADGKMVLSEIGKMVNTYWREIPAHFPFVILHEFVVMPNHVHGIIEIVKTDVERNGRDARFCVSIQDFASLPSPQPSQTNISKNKFGPQSKNLASIIRGFKMGVTINARQRRDAKSCVSTDFEWQPRFHDHIIRNSESYEKIKNYIISNPEKWNDDKFNNSEK